MTIFRTKPFPDQLSIVLLHLPLFFRFKNKIRLQQLKNQHYQLPVASRKDPWERSLSCGKTAWQLRKSTIFRKPCFQWSSLSLLCFLLCTLISSLVTLSLRTWMIKDKCTLMSLMKIEGGEDISLLHSKYWSMALWALVSWIVNGL